VLASSVTAYVSIRQPTSAYVSIRQHRCYSAVHMPRLPLHCLRQNTSAYVSIRQHTSTYVSIRQHTSAYVSIRKHTCYSAVHMPRLPLHGLEFLSEAALAVSEVCPQGAFPRNIFRCLRKHMCSAKYDTHTHTHTHTHTTTTTVYVSSHTHTHTHTHTLLYMCPHTRLRRTFRDIYILVLRHEYSSMTYTHTHLRTHMRGACSTLFQLPRTCKTSILVYILAY